MKHRIVFKCSFGGANGWGHVVRCSALASVFQKRGWETWLWSDGEAGTLPAEVRAAYSNFTKSGDISGDLLFIDEMYTEQLVLESHARAWRDRNPKSWVAGVDDMQRRSMKGFDLVLNAEIGLAAANYESRQMLLGERFALLREGFRTPVGLEVAESFRGCIPVLLMIGGTDAFGYLPRVLDSLARMASVSLAPVVVGDGGADLSRSMQRFRASTVLNRIDSVPDSPSSA